MLDTLTREEMPYELSVKDKSVPATRELRRTAERRHHHN